MPIRTTYSMLSRMFERKWTFLGTFLAVFFFTLSGLFVAGLVPSELLLIPAPSVGTYTPTGTSTAHAIGPVYAQGDGEFPMGIEIPEVGVNANVGNPNTTDVDALDEALLKGAVRYPTSAKLGEAGNVIIFGHSSHLPIVHNQAFKAFNEISKLKEGDPIFVYSQGRRYTYAVDTVTQENTTTGAIPLTNDGSRLTLATCDNFGAKSDRFVVSASLVSVTDTPKPAN